ncbi:hypothetical protein BDZ91DRAFT_548543 [Kalaharituber pfeilii]|nr:hypothetical protein BDZ91DRAFT_548543 [Kalaharituber pfeilii]
MCPYTLPVVKKFIMFFKPASIDEKKFADGFEANSIPSEAKRCQHSEADFVAIMHEITNYAFKLDEQNQILLTAESSVHYHRFIGFLFETLTAAVERLSKFRDPQRNKAQGFEVAKEEAIHALEVVDQRLCLLADLIHRSQTFRRHISHPAIKDWLRDAARRDRCGLQSLMYDFRCWNLRNQVFCSL